MHSMYLKRRREWMKSTGLQTSTASLRKAVPLFKNWNDSLIRDLPFDHTRMYYSKEYRFHLILTEPYSEVEKILVALDKDYADEYSFAMGNPNAGLWYPQKARSLLLAKPEYKRQLEIYASLLPLGIL
jgi:hypothetical protein